MAVGESRSFAEWVRTFIIRTSAPTLHTHSDQVRSAVKSDPFTPIGEVAKELRGDLKQTEKVKRVNEWVLINGLKKRSFFELSFSLILFTKECFLDEIMVCDTKQTVYSKKL